MQYIFSATLEEDDNFIEVAVKTLKAITIESELDNFYEEIEIALRFEHKNVVRCLGFYEDIQNHNRPYMILEHMSMGSLDKVLFRSNLRTFYEYVKNQSK